MELGSLCSTTKARNLYMFPNVWIHTVQIYPYGLGTWACSKLDGTTQGRFTCKS